MISIEYQSKFISKKDLSHIIKTLLSFEKVVKSGQFTKIPASIGSNSRTEKCLGTNVLILTSQPPPHPPTKNALLVRCRKNLGSATHTHEERMSYRFIWTVWYNTHEKRMSYRFIWTVWYNMRGKNCNPLGNNSILNSAKVLLPPPPLPHTHTHTRSISRTARTRLSRSHSQF